MSCVCAWWHFPNFWSLELKSKGTIFKDFFLFHTPLLAHTVEMWHWLAQPEIRLLKFLLLARGRKGLRRGFGGSGVLMENLPFYLVFFALAVFQLSFLQISALVPSRHKNACSSKGSEAAVSGTSFSCNNSFWALSIQTFFPASVDQL